MASATAAFLESLGEGAPEVPDWLPRLVARQARVELSPVASILGGMAAQEVIKATGSKVHFACPTFVRLLVCVCVCVCVSARVWKII